MIGYYSNELSKALIIMKLHPEIVAQQTELMRIRHDLHAHPELCFAEQRTADLIAAQLTQWGITVHRGLGITGVVGTLTGSAGHSQRAIGLRADMDALPLEERNTFAHRSKHPGKMHACGHDGHVTMLLGAAHYLSQHRHFCGQVHFIFQPAEEHGGGAHEMIKAGLFELFPCDAVFALHNWPGMPAGCFGVRTGAMMASSNEFKITLTGRGAHAALPHNGADPLFAACQIALGLQSIITRNKCPTDAAVLSITQMHGGDTSNIIPEQAWLAGTVRTFDVPTLNLIEQRLRDIATHTAAAHQCRADIQFDRNYPPTINHPRETALAIDVMRTIIAAENIITDVPPTMGAEDFSFMLQEKPGCYIFIGNGEGEHRQIGHGEGPCMLHNPSYDFNDDIIALGATFWTQLVKAYLKN